ncbi:MAG: hypothetical protein KGN84_07425, partial [Acidobacteriota bacterium]|nr:hypothetical protein [Acidobacteriota bacterium]
MSIEYISGKKAPKTFRAKSDALRDLINQTIQILDTLGLPIEGLSPRRLERMALAILAIVDVRNPAQWGIARDLRTPRALQTKEIVRYWRNVFDETISEGSYDDVRRKDLLLPYLSGMIVTDDPTKDTNDGTRRYGLNPEFSGVLRLFGTPGWATAADAFIERYGTLAERLTKPRTLDRMPVFL